MESRHVYSLDGLNNTLLSQGCIFEVALREGKWGGRMYIPKTEDGDKEPLTAQVQLTGQPGVISFI